MRTETFNFRYIRHHQVAQGIKRSERERLVIWTIVVGDMDVDPIDFKEVH
jgi:hypothetical protein